MTRLIDADEFLKNEIKRCGCVPLIGSCTSDNEIFKFILEQQPTVDAVEVVRCKDCEYFMEDIFKRTVCNRTFDMFVMKANDFCSYGKRKIKGVARNETL